jgi:CHAT domain-containing protein
VEKEELIHLACHGEYKSDAPLLSNLRLAPSEKEDGRLEVHEIFDLDLKPNLVVLSACQTGMGKRSSGDEITGLTRAFIYAGAPSIITTLWSVNDKSTADLMVRFYDHFKIKSKVEALQLAQLETMKKYPQPFYWAPFCLTGDYQ